MSQSQPIWAQIHTVDPVTGATSFTKDVIVAGKVLEAFSTFTAPPTFSSGGGSSSGWFNLATTLTGATTTENKTAQHILTFSGLTADYAGTIAAWDAVTTTDTGAFNYTGILRGGMGHVLVVAVGATINKMEGLAGVVQTFAGSTGTITDTYGTSGEIIHGGSNTFTHVCGTIGTVTTTGDGNVTAGYGAINEVITTNGVTGVFTTGVGTLSIASHNAATTCGTLKGLQAYVDLTDAGTSGTTIGGQLYVQAASSATATSGAIGVDAFVAWGSSTALSIAYGLQVHINNTGGAVISSAEAIHILAPTVTQVTGVGSNTATRGIRIADQSGAHTGTSTALYIDNQATAGATAIKTNGGLHTFGASANTGSIFTVSDLTTTLYTVDSRNTNGGVSAHTFTGPVTTVASSAGNHYSVINVPAYTYGTTGTTTITAINGLALAIAAPTISSAGASATALASTAYIGGAPINAGSGSITAAYALHVAGAVRLDVGVANAAVATVLGSVGCTGSHTTVQEWIKITTASGDRFVPGF